MTKVSKATCATKEMNVCWCVVVVIHSLFSVCQCVPSLVWKWAKEVSQVM